MSAVISTLAAGSPATEMRLLLEDNIQKPVGDKDDPRHPTLSYGGAHPLVRPSCAHCFPFAGAPPDVDPATQAPTDLHDDLDLLLLEQRQIGLRPSRAGGDAGQTESRMDFLCKVRRERNEQLRERDERLPHGLPLRSHQRLPIEETVELV